MRTNLPITQREYTFPEQDTLVSTTDLKGRITYCNPAFITVSGYEKDELIGQPHNMIRHPDMPEEAFRDMWDTIAKGRPWSGLVKNRRKNGDHYWVRANVTPLLNGDQPVGYMSVRTLPSTDAVRQAESLYARLRDQHKQGSQSIALREGHVVHRGVRGWWAAITHLGLGTRIVATSALAAPAAVAVAAAIDGHLGELLQGAGLAGLAASLAVGAAAGTWLARSVVRPLEGLLVTANRMAAGDLTQRIRSDRSDLLGRLTLAMGQLNVNLRSIVRDARSEVDAMKDVAREIATGNQDLSGRTESQASSLEQTASSMEEITGTVRNSVESAQQASNLAQQASHATQHSSEVVRDVTQTMQQISESSKRIAEIIQVIDSISFQTNILALNAAVEAARAGEQGRGFAVVAGEVRALAQRTSTASREIRDLIQASTDKVLAGQQLSETARTAMVDAVEKVQHVSTLIAEISSGAQEQLTGISQVNEAVTHLDTLTQQNAAMVEQLAASAVSLQAQAQNVSESVGVFKVDSQAAVGDAVALRRQAKSRRQQAEPQPA